jgi:hypothetical protein
MIRNQVGMMIAHTEKHYDESTRVTDRLIHFSSFYLLDCALYMILLQQTFACVSNLS